MVKAKTKAPKKSQLGTGDTPSATPKAAVKVVRKKEEEDEASYLKQLRPAFPHRTDAELDLICSASRRLQGETGLSAHEHRKRGMSALFPSRVWTGWREDRVASIQYCLENRIQELMWMGSSNSCKSADMADLAITLWLTKPETTSIYVASPYESATETGLWAYIQEQFDEAKDHNPTIPGKKRFSDNSIILNDRNPRSFIRAISVDQVGKLVGKKSRDFSYGMLVLIFDELPAFTPTSARALLSVMPNLISVPNLLVLGAGNFANVGDALGVFCDPDETDIPNGYDGFDPDRHFRWRTKRGGLCLRFDGLQSPNVKAGQDIYPFVTTIEYIGKLASQPGGLLSADAMRFIRSAPCTSLDEFTVINGERIRAGGAYDKFEWTADTITRGAYIDPGFGGDECVVQKFKLGYQKTGTGKRQILALWDAPFTIPIRIGLRKEDKIVPVEDQIVLGAKAYAEEFQIPPRNIGYDGSMRAGLAQKMVTLWSPHVRPLDSGGPPTDRRVDASSDVTWKQKVDRFLSELWFACASTIDSFQLRDLQLSPKAVQQLCLRRWEWSAGKGRGKRRVQTKLEYKDMRRQMGQGGESPNEADALVGCVEIARQLGFGLEGVVVGGGSLNMVLEMIKERESKHSLGLAQRRPLPTGTLHAIHGSRDGTSRGGRLHRN